MHIWWYVPLSYFIIFGLSFYVHGYRAVLGLKSNTDEKEREASNNDETN